MDWAGKPRERFPALTPILHSVRQSILYILYLVLSFYYHHAKGTAYVLFPQEAYKTLPLKSLVYFVSVYDQLAPKFIVKVDDDQYVLPNRLLVAAAQWEVADAGRVAQSYGPGLLLVYDGATTAATATSASALDNMFTATSACL